MSETKRPVGRPSSLKQEHIDGAKWYLKGGFAELEPKQVVPSIAGLACYLGVERNRIREWGTQNDEFQTTLEAIKSAQEVLLINNGLTGDFNATITKLMMSNHGYSDKVDSDITNSDGNLKPSPAMTAEQFAEIAREVLKEI